MSRYPSSRAARRRIIPRVEALEDRCVLTSCNFIVSGGTLTIQSPVTPTPVNETITLFDNGGAGANNLTAFCVQPFFPNVPISRVVVNTRTGNNRVQYNLIGDLVAPRRVDVNFGNGNDRFLGVIRRNLLNGGNLSLNVNGGPGSDRLEAVLIGSLAPGAAMQLNFNGGGGNNVENVFFASFVNIAAGASLGLNLVGSGSSDRIFSQYQGQLNGTLQVNESGGGGPNTLFSDIEMAPGSTGTVLPSALIGGPARDRLTFTVHNPGTAQSNSNQINGNGGGDDCFRTSNVTVFSVATDHVLP
jgi:hypothetical protein